MGSVTVTSHYSKVTNVCNSRARSEAPKAFAYMYYVVTDEPFSTHIGNTVYQLKSRQGAI